ncbi:MAG: hypothetical protein P8R42_07660 [Candidatus Binatia bacterium]|nr:hypothetical protein [Candidatus Binatia bacterium]
MIHYSNPPVLLRNVFEDVGDVTRLLERNAPYTPLGGWYRPGADLDVASSPMWFQNDWVHADLRVEGSELFLFHKRVTQAARDFYEAQVIVPHSVYVNMMAALDRAGPAHTDNPRFHGRDRSNTPMFLLRTMLWSGLFDDFAIVQATSIWWMNDVEGGGLLYWPDGPDSAPHEHVGNMANTALVGDNHGMFHQVGPVGPFDKGTRLVTPRAECAPAADGSADWAVVDRGEVRYQAPLDRYRVSVLWKADVYRDEAEQKRQLANTLSIPDVVEIFNRDLEAKGQGVRLDADRIEDAGLIAEVSAIYPEAVPAGRAPSIFDAA